MYAYLDTVGKIQTGSGASSINSLNDILIGFGTAIGVIIITVGLIKLVMSLSEQNANAKQSASLLIGTGIFFISVTQVINALDITNNAQSGNTQAIALKIVELISNLVSWAGGVLLAIAVIQMVMSIAQERPDDKVDATKLMGVSIGLLSVCTVAKTIASSAFRTASGGDGSTVLRLVVTFIANIATYVGGGYVVLGVYHLISSIREDDSREKVVAIRFLLVGIGLISIKAILRYFGLITASSTSSSVTQGGTTWTIN